MTPLLILQLARTLTPLGVDIADAIHRWYDKELISEDAAESALQLHHDQYRIEKAEYELLIQDLREQE